MTQPPSGTVTFLFTDIEGSTKLWEKFPEAMKPALARHDTILRTSVESNNGYIVKMRGDGIHAAFADVQDAFAMTLAAQRALQAEAWGETGPLRVRYGLHTGAVEERDGDYFGSAVNLAARLLSAGHGGQILLTQATRDAVAHNLPPEVSFLDKGDVRLKDLKRPEHVYQLVAPGLPSEFPPLISLSTLDAHYETVLRAISDGRLVFFLGSGVNATGRPADKKWQFGQSDLSPSRFEIATYLAKNFDYPANEVVDLVRVSQHVALKEGIGRLYDELRRLLKPEFEPTALHLFMAILPGILRARGYPPNQLIVTTNFDDTLERAFRAAGEEFDLVYYAAEGADQGKFVHRSPDGKVRPIDKPNKYLSLSLDERTVILKMYGMIDRAQRERDSFVITEDHYIDYLARKDVAQQVPAKLLEKMSLSYFLFLGYSLINWNLRVILHRFWGEEPFKYRSWAIQHNPTSSDKHFWSTRNVEVLGARLEDYIEDLGDRMQSLPPAEAQL